MTLQFTLASSNSYRKRIWNKSLHQPTKQLNKFPDALEQNKKEKINNTVLFTTPFAKLLSVAFINLPKQEQKKSGAPSLPTFLLFPRSDYFMTAIRHRPNPSLENFILI